ncbi:MAG: DUF2470 domain-containing protein, partial [Thermodesulfobacteriota bacterium]
NIDRDSRASLFISEINSVDDPLNATRATLMGNISKVRENEAGIAKNIYLLSHPNANYWVSFSDFSFYKMEIEDIYFVGGFGSMGWVTVDEYYKAEIDPLADIASEIISHMNEDHSDSLILLSKAYTKIAAEEASMLSVDRFGFNVRIRAGQQMYGRRIAFSKEVSNSNEVRKILIQMVKEVKDKR